MAKANTTFNKGSFTRLYPWIIWLLSSSFVFYKYLLQVSPTVMIAELMQYYSLSGQALGNLAAYYFYAYLCMQLPVGILLDNFNTKRLITLAISVCALGAALFAHAQHLATAELGRILIGVGGAFSAVGAMKLISLWFPPKRFALVAGLMMTVGMLGAVGGIAPLAYMVSYFGWRQSMSYCAMVGVILAILFLCIVREKQVISEHSINQSIKSFAKEFKRIVTKKQSWLISLYSGLAFAPISAFAGFWGVPFLIQKYGIGREIIADLVAFAFIGFAIGAPLSGWLSDHLGKRKPIMNIGTLLGFLILTAIIYLPNVSIGLLGIMLFAFGLFTSFFFISFAVMREINPAHLSGTSIGFINLFNALFGAISQPAIGFFLDKTWDHTIINGVRVFSISNYKMALIFFPGIMLLSLILMLFVNETYCGKKI